jgi:5-methylcytosine-specific restriction endonuclease McrA
VSKVTLLWYTLSVTSPTVTTDQDPQARLETARIARKAAQREAMHASAEAYDDYQYASLLYDRARKSGALTPEIRATRAAAELAAKKADPVKYQAFLAAQREYNNAKYAVAPWYDGSEEAKAAERARWDTMRVDPDKVAAYRKRKREYVKERRVHDEQYRVRERLRARLRGVVSGTQTTRSKTYGIDWQAILDHLGPCPGDPAGYHVDHIVPLSSFDLTDPAQVKAAFAPTNHQWLTTTENLSKSSKLPGESTKLCQT